MTKEEVKYLSEVLKAYSEGKDIEIASKDCSDWIPYNISKDADSEQEIINAVECLTANNLIR